MPEARINKYEGLFLFPQAALADLGAAVEHVHHVLNRASAELIAIAKWDERRLAYDIQSNKRGLYILAYFRAAAEKMVDLERDCNLSEQLLRAMILRADHLTEEEMKAFDARQALEDEIVLRRERKDAVVETDVPDETEEEPVAAEYDAD